VTFELSAECSCNGSFVECLSQPGQEQATFQWKSVTRFRYRLVVPVIRELLVNSASARVGLLSSVKMRVLRTLSFNPGGKEIGALDRNYDAN
jgi:hypothetical protein